MTGAHRTRPRAAAALALSGRYADLGRQSAAGLRAWAEHAGVRIEIEDDRSDAGRSARLASRLASRADLLFGPYGSGPARAVAEEMAGSPAVVWNHGGAAVEPRAGRMVDVLGPADTYWRGLVPALRRAGGDPGAVAVVRSPGGFGASVAAGALAAIEGAGVRPAAVLDLDPERPARAAEAAAEAGARWVAGGGRAEDDLALAREAATRGLRPALVVCGVGLAERELGDAVLGALGPVQWLAGGPPPPARLPAGCDYPAAQALAAGLVAREALDRAGTAAPDDLWEAARALRTATFLGPFRVDAEGRQVAHAPLIVRWEGGDGAAPRRRVVWRPGEPTG